MDTYTNHVWILVPLCSLPTCTSIEMHHTTRKQDGSPWNATTYRLSVYMPLLPGTTMPFPVHTMLTLISTALELWWKLWFQARMIRHPWGTDLVSTSTTSCRSHTSIHWLLLRPWAHNLLNCSETALTSLRLRHEHIFSNNRLCLLLGISNCKHQDVQTKICSTLLMQRMQRVYWTMHNSIRQHDCFFTEMQWFISSL